MNNSARELGELAYECGFPRLSIAKHAALDLLMMIVNFFTFIFFAAAILTLFKGSSVALAQLIKVEVALITIVAILIGIHVAIRKAMRRADARHVIEGKDAWTTWLSVQQPDSKALVAIRQQLRLNHWPPVRLFYVHTKSAWFSGKLRWLGEEFDKEGALSDEAFREKLAPHHVPALKKFFLEYMPTSTEYLVGLGASKQGAPLFVITNERLLQARDKGGGSFVEVSFAEVSDVQVQQRSFSAQVSFQMRDGRSVDIQAEQVPKLDVLRGLVLRINNAETVH